MYVYGTPVIKQLVANEDQKICKRKGKAANVVNVPAYLKD